MRELPADPAAIPDALENFVIHHAIARQLGFGVPDAAEPDRNLRSLARLIEALVGRDSRPLTEHRDLPDYLYGTCHDFALLATGALRERGVPARLRVGYAGYFNPGRWEDHWICEYRTAERWAVLDGQLGPRARVGFKIGFPVADVPGDGWRSAPSIWRAIRAGTVDAGICGVSFAGIKGRWFVASAVLRDAAALAGIECLPWDYWGPARRFRETREVTEAEAKEIDALAEALDPAPATQDAAAAVLERFPWARPTDTVESVIVTTPVEVPIRPPLAIASA
ncbi:MAG TPA: transglutaminase domain-containing protein [Stellaceae bacterium]|nr:transglutaminase domain-containing protein [Stellaceae bacterium]